MSQEKLCERYFNFDALEYEIDKYESQGIDAFLEDISDDKELMLICGDFYGIQKFIFDNLTTEYAAKVLRAKSAFIQIFTDYLVEFICYRFCYRYGRDKTYKLSSKAGKIEILSKNLDESIIKDIQKTMDNYFMKYFFGLSGVKLFCCLCNKDSFENKYTKLREAISNKEEQAKFNKFDLLHKTEKEITFSCDKDLNHQTLCPMCNMRRIKIDDESCEICNSFVQLGKMLTSCNQGKLDNEKILNLYLFIKLKECLKDNFRPQLILDEKIISYVHSSDDEEENNNNNNNNKNKQPTDFKTLANYSCNPESGIKALGALKADVDNLGKSIKKLETFEEFDTFSNNLNNFFSLYVPKLMEKEFKHTYMVFAGGDDLFLVGAWDEILELARQIRNDFRNFVKEKLSVSFGICISRPNTPISYLAQVSEELLKNAKDIDDTKDAISIFDENTKWHIYNEVYDKLCEVIGFDRQKKEFNHKLNTKFYYEILEFCKMSQNLNKAGRSFNPKDALWKSKLNYSFGKYNTQKELEYEKLEKLVECIEKHPKAVKMVFSEFIYLRREEQ
ncbi:type III-A CRISPR-associated protein Cas10/Csm1 [Helicobacter cetorum]|uniref:type III-A CRISPR-associated protein Cas10/Csm1 n=1 Tax=Helicobacter cetorum TaxID=138563 RepID=UPI000CF15521|nr:type III-A CRISPR-associated protein Cas10/Csm1 [Helicobacter cetorum]